MIGVRAQQGHKRTKPVQWKGKTFAQITTSLQRNVRRSVDITIADHPEFMRAISKPLPLSGYRRELTTTVQNNQRRTQTILRLDTPGGTIVRANFDESGNPDFVTNCNGLANTLDICYSESKYDRPNCLSKTDSLSQQENARRRVRSSGMDREIGKTKKYYTSSKEYLHSRNRRFQQNEFHNLHEQSDPTKTVFRSNTVPYCATVDRSDYVPVFYKPNNGKFGQQGAVDSSSRITRLKYDTITDMGNTYRVAFDKYGNGNGTANALSYGVSSNGYTIKDKLGFPNTRTPVFKNGNLCCAGGLVVSQPLNTVELGIVDTLGFFENQLIGGTYMTFSEIILGVQVDAITTNFDGAPIRGSYIKVNGVLIAGDKFGLAPDGTNTALAPFQMARGHTITVLNPATGLSRSGFPKCYDTYGGVGLSSVGTAGIADDIKNAAAGDIIVMGTYDATSCNIAMRNAMTTYTGANTYSNTWSGIRTSHMFLAKRNNTP